MGRGNAFKNVVCLGHILDSQGKKMSKSLVILTYLYLIILLMNGDGIMVNMRLFYME
jgi:isoleucyl-tRNA synthetase